VNRGRGDWANRGKERAFCKKLSIYKRPGERKVELKSRIVERSKDQSLKVQRSKCKNPLLDIVTLGLFDSEPLCHHRILTRYLQNRF
jgi:hypothetical protein